MGDHPAPEQVALDEDYYHVRFRDPDDFETIRTPDWAENVAHEIASGSEVRMGKREGSDDWVVQSILIEKHAGESTAREEAQQILEKIES